MNRRIITRAPYAGAGGPAGGNAGPSGQTITILVVLALFSSACGSSFQTNDEPLSSDASTPKDATPDVPRGAEDAGPGTVVVPRGCAWCQCPTYWSVVRTLDGCGCMIPGDSVQCKGVMP